MRPLAALLGRGPVEVLQPVAAGAVEEGEQLARARGVQGRGHARELLLGRLRAHGPDASRCHRRAPRSRPEGRAAGVSRSGLGPDTLCGDGHQRVRPLLRGHRPLQLAHRGADAGRAHLRAGPAHAPACSSRWAGCGPSCSARSAPPATATARSRPSCSAWRARRPRPPTPRAADPRLAEVRATGRLRLDGTHEIACDVDTDVVLHRRKTLPFHSNGMRFTAWASAAARGRGAAAPARVLLGRRRLRARPGRGRRERDRARPHPGAVPVHHRRPAARAVRGDRPADQRRDDGQRAVVAHRGRGARGPAAPLAGHAGVHRQRLPVRGRAARRAQGAARAPRGWPPSCAASTPATRWPPWTG